MTTTVAMENAVVVDTDVVSFFLKRDTRADRYEPHLLGKTLVMSFMTLAELERWALERNWGPIRRRQMEATLSRYILHPFDRTLCVLWARVTDDSRRRGHPINVADAWIAATALYQGIPLVTNNEKHFTHVEGLSVIAEPPE